jgi:hypothetical protein
LPDEPGGIEKGIDRRVCGIACPVGQGKHAYRAEQDQDFNSYFLLFNWKEGPEEVQFRLKKTSQNGSGRRRKQV